MKLERITSPLVLKKRAREMNDKGDGRVLQFLREPDAADDLIAYVWEIEYIEMQIERMGKSRLEVLTEYASGACSCSQTGLWGRLADDCCRRNGLDPMEVRRGGFALARWCCLGSRRPARRAARNCTCILAKLR